MIDKEILKAILTNVVLSNLKEAKEENDAVQEKRAALVPSFETEEEALKCARRVATLHPGDMVRIINKDDTGLIPAVFVGFDTSKHSHAIVLYYDDGDKQLGTGEISLHGIVVD